MQLIAIKLDYPIHHHQLHRLQLRNDFQLEQFTAGRCFTRRAHSQQKQSGALLLCSAIKVNGAKKDLALLVAEPWLILDFVKNFSLLVVPQHSHRHDLTAALNCISASGLSSSGLK